LNYDAQLDSYFVLYWSLLFFVNWMALLNGNRPYMYFPSLAIQFDITLLRCISMLDYCISVVSRKTSLH